MNPWFYYIWFVSLGLLLLIVRQVAGSNKGSISNSVLPPGFSKFQKNYVMIYLLAMGADWLQGPYVYRLYREYNFSIGDIGTLFVAGFASSAIFGTIAGTLADKYGRKAMVIVFGVFYGISCVTKHFPDFNILMLGRVMGGVSTSLLFSAFESWMVHTHHENAYPEDLVGLTNAMCTSGNAIVAVTSGIFASFLVEKFGAVAPFDASLVLLVILTFAVSMSWTENRGDASIDLTTTLTNAFTRVRQDKKVWLLGATQSLFEGAMYIFVFMWAPALEATAEDPTKVNHGWVFASFMVSVFVGSEVFKYFLNRKHRVERTAVYLFAVAAVALSVPIVSENHTLRLMSFFVFEMCVGMFWPSLGTLRSRYVPEEVRATIMNIFRIPLNLIVVLVLIHIDRLGSNVWYACVGCLIPALLCVIELASITVDSTENAKKTTDVDSLEEVSLLEVPATSDAPEVSAAVP